MPLPVEAAHKKAYEKPAAVQETLQREIFIYVR